MTNIVPLLYSQPARACRDDYDERHTATVGRGNPGHRHYRQSHAQKMPGLQDPLPGDPQRAWQRRANPVRIALDFERPIAWGNRAGIDRNCGLCAQRDQLAFDYVCREGWASQVPRALGFWVGQLDEIAHKLILPLP
jgi:hypothetical protein